MRLSRRAEQSTLWQEDPPASPRLWQGDGKVMLTTAGCGLTSSALCERYAPRGSWQRTLSESLALSLTALGGCAISLRLRATRPGRSLLVPTTLARRTAARGCGLWPTATAQDTGSSGSAGYSTESGRHGGTTLTDAANGLWASPQARDWKDSGPTQGKRHSPNLGTEVNFPTPKASDGRVKGTGGSPDHGLDAMARVGLLDPENHSTSGKPRGSLNPAWVAQLMGFPDGWLCPPSSLSDEWLFPVTAGRRSRRSGMRASLPLSKS